MEITDLNNNPGLFALKIGKVFINEGYHRIIHEFKLQPFHSILRQYELVISELGQNKQLEEVVAILKQKHKQTSMILQNLTLRRKQKRSINILGSVVKSITDNLDNKDLVTLNKQINLLKSSNNILITENNEQVKINEIFEDRINNLTQEAFKQSI